MATAANVETYRLISLDSVRATGRVRQDMGDVAGLAASIESVGLLHPIVVTPDGALVAGARRIAAYRLLGRAVIPSVVAHDMASAVRLLNAERDENVCRKDFTLSEAVALKRLTEAEEKPKAAARKQATQAKKGERIGAAKLAEPIAGARPRDVAAAATGYGHTTLSKAEAVVAAAEKDPDAFAPLVAEMDASGNADRAHKKLRALTEPAPDKPKARAFDVDKEKERVREWCLARAREWPKEKRPLLAVELEMLARNVQKGIIG